MENLVGKTVASVQFDKYENLVLTFTDGTTLVAREAGYEGYVEVVLNGEVVESKVDTSGA